MGCGSSALRLFPSITANRVAATSMAMNSGIVPKSTAQIMRISPAGLGTCQFCASLRRCECRTSLR